MNQGASRVAMAVLMLGIGVGPAWAAPQGGSTSGAHGAGPAEAAHETTSHGAAGGGEAEASLAPAAEAASPDALGSWGETPVGGWESSHASAGAGEVAESLEHAEGDLHDAGQGGHAHANHIAVFLAPVTALGEVDGAVGLDYEHRLAFHEQLLGIQAFSEIGYGDESAWLAGAGVAAHPFKGLKVVLGVGVEGLLAEGEEPAAREAVEGGEEASHGPGALGRLSAEYAVDVRRLSLAPTAVLDVAHGHLTTLYGLSVGLGF